MDKPTELAGNDDGPVSVTLGDAAASAQARLDSGEFETLSDVVQEGLRALDREDEEMDMLRHNPAWVAYVRAKVQESLDDPRPPLSQQEFDARMDDFTARYRAEHGL